MKRCPTCNRTFDDPINFCLTDGTPLVAEAPAPPPQPTPSFAQPTAPIQSVPTANWQPPPGGSYGQQFQPPQQGKRKVWPWVLGIVGLLLVGGVVLLGVIGYVGYRAVKRAQVERKAGPATTSRADTKTYVSSRANFTGKLAEHYTDFSFEYPSDWQLDPKAGKGNSSNFVKVERSLSGGGGNFTLENFAVGWYTSTGTMAGDAALFPQLTAQLSQQFAQGFPGYEKVSEGRTRVGNYDGYEFRFKSRAKDTPKGDVSFYGRVVLIPGGSASQRNGVALVMLASSLAPEIEGSEDVGVKGETPVILDTFRLGPSAASRADTTSGSVSNASGGGAPTDEAAVLETLREIEDEWTRANIEGDRDALENILADDYVGTSADGTRETKKQYLARLKPDPSLKSQTFKNLDVSLSGDTATLKGQTVAHFKDGTNTTFDFTDTFKWLGGRWQAVASEASPVQ